MFRSALLFEGGVFWLSLLAGEVEELPAPPPLSISYETVQQRREGALKFPPTVDDPFYRETERCRGILFYAFSRMSARIFCRDAAKIRRKLWKVFRTFEHGIKEERCRRCKKNEMRNANKCEKEGKEACIANAFNLMREVAQ